MVAFLSILAKWRARQFGSWINLQFDEVMIQQVAIFAGSPGHTGPENMEKFWLENHDAAVPSGSRIGQFWPNIR